MKHDKLKAFIEEHRNNLDSEEPAESLWNKIERDLDQGVSTRTSAKRYWPFAASIMILLGAASFFYFNELAAINSRATVEEEVQEIATGLEEIDRYYALQVNEKTAALADYEIDPDIQEELNVLKVEFDELTEDLGVGANPELIIEAMINNYRLRISILEDLLNALQQERTNSSIPDDEIV